MHLLESLIGIPFENQSMIERSSNKNFSFVRIDNNQTEIILKDQKCPVHLSINLLTLKTF